MLPSFDMHLSLTLAKLEVNVTGRGRFSIVGVVAGVGNWLGEISAEDLYEMLLSFLAESV